MKQSCLFACICILRVKCTQRRQITLHCPHSFNIFLHTHLKLPQIIPPSKPPRCLLTHNIVLGSAHGLETREALDCTSVLDVNPNSLCTSLQQLVCVTSPENPPGLDLCTKQKIFIYFFLPVGPSHHMFCLL